METNIDKIYSLLESGMPELISLVRDCFAYSLDESDKIEFKNRFGHSAEYLKYIDFFMYPPMPDELKSIRAFERGWGCGYVYTPEDKCHENYDVHGGVTYCRDGKIGFDTAHFMDNIYSCPFSYVLEQTLYLASQVYGDID